MPSSTFFLFFGMLVFAGVSSCRSRDLKDAIAEETCDCITKQPPGRNILQSLTNCQQEAIDRNKPLLKSQLKIDTGSNGAMVNLSLELAILLNSNCDFIKQHRPMLDSVLKIQ